MSYIDAEKMQSLLEEEIEECGNPTAEDNPIAYGTTLGLKMALSYAKTLPTADVAPVIHAHWIHKFQYANHDHCYICSACGMSERVPYRGYEKRFLHCHCGAKMDEEVKE